jgi:hypothetical protein
MTTTKQLAITHPLRAFGLIWFGQLVSLVGSGLTGFAADTAPPLLVLGAQAVIASTQGECLVPLEAFFLGPGRTVLQPGELLKEIVVPKPPDGSGSFYICHTPRLDGLRGSGRGRSHHSGC